MINFVLKKKPGKNKKFAPKMVSLQVLESYAFEAVYGFICR